MIDPGWWNCWSCCLETVPDAERAHPCPTPDFATMPSTAYFISFLPYFLKFFFVYFTPWFNTPLKMYLTCT
jgi:hypothetical protein